MLMGKWQSEAPVKLFFQIAIDLLKMLMTPGVFIFGLYELFLSWMRSRRWLSLIYLLPSLGLAGAILGHRAYYQWGKDPEVLLNDYWTLVDSEIKAPATDVGPQESNTDTLSVSEEGTDGESGPSPKWIQEENISPFGEILIRKTLQLDRSNLRAVYLAGTALGKQGRLGQARQLMRSIAPKAVRGYPPAHAWLAADRLQPSQPEISNPQEMSVLLHDLSIAQGWSGASVELLSVHADLLIQDQRVNDAMNVLKEAAKREPLLAIRLAGLAKHHKRQEVFDEVLAQVSTIRNDRIDKGLGSELDYVLVASLLMLHDEVNAAIALAQSGLHQYRDSEQLKRLLSNGFILQFDATRETVDVTDESRLNLLELAMRADPTNSHVLEKLSALVASKSISSEEVAAKLRQHLASGKLTAISHLLLAIAHLRDSDLEKAMVHLEMAHSQSPNNPIILNNLALCMARIRPNELPQAKALIERALAVGGPDAERLDTYGEILARGGDYLSAVRAFEAALDRNPDANSTRRKLAEAYERMSMNEMAEAVRNAIREKSE